MNGEDSSSSAQLLQNFVDSQSWLSSWYKAKSLKDVGAASDALSSAPAGSFLICDDSSNPLRLNLFLKYGGGVSQYPILISSDGDGKLEKGELHFSTLSALVEYYSYQRNGEGELPCALLASHPGVVAASMEGAGSPWGVNEVCNWLDSLNLNTLAPTFRAKNIDGPALLRMQSSDLAAMNVTGTVQENLLKRINSLSRKIETQPNPPEVQKVTLVLKNIDGKHVLLDTATGEEVTDMLGALAGTRLESKNSPLETSDASSSSFRGEFFWDGTDRGWFRNVKGISMPALNWSAQDLCDWLRHMQMDSLVRAFGALEITGAMMEHLSPEEFLLLGEKQGLRNEFSVAFTLFHVRAFGGLLKPTMPLPALPAFPAHGHGVTTSSAPLRSPRPSYLALPAPGNASRLLSLIDGPARHASWFKGGLPPSQYESSIDELEGKGSFVIVDHPDDNSQLLLYYINEELNLSKLPLVCSDKGLHVGGSQRAFSDLSEIVYYFSNHNNMAPFALAIPTRPNDHINTTWYRPNIAESEASALVLTQWDGFFIVRDLDVSTQSYLIEYSHNGRLRHASIITTPEGLKLEDSALLFPTLRSLIDYYRAVNTADLPCRLQLNPPVKHNVFSVPALSALDPKAANALYYLGGVPAGYVVDLLRDAPENSFVVADDLHNEAGFVLYHIQDGVLSKHTITNSRQGLFLEGDSEQAYPKLSALIDRFCDSQQVRSLPFSLVDGFNTIKHTTPPIGRLDHMSSSWYHTPLTEEEINALVHDQPSGTFIVRESNDDEGVFFLDYVGTAGINEVPIYYDEQHNGYYLAEEQELFFSLAALVSSHYFVASGLDVLLAIPSVAHIPFKNKNQPEWMRLGMSRDEALAPLLSETTNGVFVIRTSESFPDSYVLSYVYNGEIHSEMIRHANPELCAEKGVFLDCHSAMVFQDLPDLVDYLLNSEGGRRLLKCPLVLKGFPSQKAPRAPELWEEEMRDRTLRTPATRGIAPEGWNQIGVPKDTALSTLLGGPDGAFIVRDSESVTNGLVLCYMYGGNLYQELIMVSSIPPGFYLEKTPKLFFHTLEDLVVYFARPRPEILVPLLVPGLVQYSPYPLQYSPYQFVSAAPTMERVAFDHLTLENQHNTSTLIMRSTMHPEPVYLTQSPQYSPVRSYHSSPRFQSSPRSHYSEVRHYEAQGFDPSEKLKSFRSHDSHKSHHSSRSSRHHEGERSSKSHSKHGESEKKEGHHSYRHYRHHRSHHSGTAHKASKGDTILTASPYPWLKLHLSKSEASRRLKGEGDGEFIVHRCSDAWGELSFVHRKVIHSRRLIARADGLCLQGSKERFDTIEDLIEHYQRPSQTDLPIELREH